MVLERKIIHIDMDAYFAAIEQRDNSAYRGKPVVVGGDPYGRGVVATASYEARKFGIRSAMSAAKAYQLCPQAIFVRPRFQVYKHVSAQIMGLFREYTDLVEPLSLDEAWLDVTRNKKRFWYASQIGKDIKNRIFDYTGLTSSVGVAPNKFLAKIASDLKKPDGLSVITPEEVEGFIATLPIQKVPGVGKVTAEKMARSGVIHLGDLNKFLEGELRDKYGKQGAWFAGLAKGIDNREIVPYREPKSIGNEDTFEQDLVDLDKIEEELFRIAGKVSERLKKAGKKGKTIVFKVTWSDFEKITRSRSISSYTDQEKVIFDNALKLMTQTEAGKRPLRLLGITVSGFESSEDSSQMTLF